MIATFCQDKTREGEKKGHQQSLDPHLSSPMDGQGGRVEAGTLKMSVKAEKEVGSASLLQQSEYLRQNTLMPGPPNV